jgi:prepilin-type N-terminal cleavage/methylation domain-containing protein
MVASNPRTTAGCHCRLARQCSTANRSGFTLVELLTVIVIIGILAGLVTAAAVHATGTARQFAITNEIAQLGMALEQYKIKFGEYPPDFAGIMSGDATIRSNAKLAVINHIKRAFPRYRIVGTDVTTQWNNLNADIATVDINRLGPAMALAFWLGGPPAAAGSTKLAGFSANPANPFILGGSRLDPLFEFDETRLIVDEISGITIYFPPYVRHPDGGNNIAPPYVYFRARSGGYVPAMANFPLAGAGTCVPYASHPDTAGIAVWINPKTYQIICSGRDGYYSNPTASNILRYLKTDPNDLTIEEDDNLTSFATGSLEDMVE